jgi:hypothetical protein
VGSASRINVGLQLADDIGAYQADGVNARGRKFSLGMLVAYGITEPDKMDALDLHNN